jgi:hypothetical protein
MSKFKGTTMFFNNPELNDASAHAARLSGWKKQREESGEDYRLQAWRSPKHNHHLLLTEDYSPNEDAAHLLRFKKALVNSRANEKERTEILYEHLFAKEFLRESIIPGQLNTASMDVCVPSEMLLVDKSWVN